MNGFAILGSFQKRALFLLLLVVTALLTLAAAVHYATPLNGIPSSQVRYLDSGWFYEEGGRLLPIAQLPCRVDVSSGTLHLTRNLSDAVLNPDDVLAIETRYQSIRVWADQTLIYEAAQGQAHALSIIDVQSNPAYSAVMDVHLLRQRQASGTIHRLFDPSSIDRPQRTFPYLAGSLHLPSSVG